MENHADDRDERIAFAFDPDNGVWYEEDGRRIPDGEYRDAIELQLMAETTNFCPCAFAMLTRDDIAATCGGEAGRN